jgi:anti-sigma factor RsiW
MTDRGTLQDHVDDLLEETSRLYKQVQRLEAAAQRAATRAALWAKLYDELQELLNEELYDDDE